MNEVAGKIIRAALIRDARYYLLLHWSYVYIPPLRRQCETVEKQNVRKI